MGATDAFGLVIREAVREVFREHTGESEKQRLYSVQQAAEYIDASKREVYNLIARGDLPRIQHGRRTKIDKRDLDAWIDRKKRVA